MAITFDTVRKHIVLDSSNESWAVIWSRWIDWAALPENRQWPLAFDLVGGISLGGGLFIPPYFFLKNGWLVRPMEANHDLILTGNGFVEGGGVPVAQTLGIFRVNVQYTVPVQAQGIATNGSTGATPTEIANAVLASLNATTIPVNAVSGDWPTPSENAIAVWSHVFVTKLLTVAKFLGLK